MNVQPYIMAVSCALLAILYTHKTGNVPIEDFCEVSISMNEAFCDSIIGQLDKPEFVVLKEDDNTMFADMDRILDKNGKYIAEREYIGRSQIQQK